MSDFKIGDRVRTKEIVKDKLAKGAFTGTFMGVDRGGLNAYVLRDDGLKGAAGTKGYWTIVLGWIELSPEEHEVARSEGAGEGGHIAGLSPERVDWDKVMHGRWKEEE